MSGGDDTTTHEVDAAIIGGGIAALWTANRLVKEGYSTLLLTSSDLGDGQTLAAQGVIHGGLKYAVGGKLTEASEALAAMPERWRRCLRGEGEVDLRAAKVLSGSQILWSLPSVASKVVAFFGTRALQNRARPLDRHAYPPPFDHPAYRGRVFELEEMVLDPVSVVAALAATVGEAAWRIDWDQAVLEAGRREFREVKIGAATVRARRWILAAGAGNEGLMERAGITGVKMRRRPLHQVVIRSETLPDQYSVCIGTGAKPPVVITTHRDSKGEKLWYVGGDLAETTTRGDGGQVAFAQGRFAELLPWVDFSGAEWSTVRVDRAEPETSTQDRPPGSYCQLVGNVIITWPTKLALAPDLADQVLGLLGKPGSRRAGDSPTLALALPRPAVGRPPWDR